MNRTKLYRTIRRAVHGYQAHGVRVDEIELSPKLFGLLNMPTIGKVPLRENEELNGTEFVILTESPKHLDGATERELKAWGARMIGNTSELN